MLLFVHRKTKHGNEVCTTFAHCGTTPTLQTETVPVDQRMKDV